MSTHPLLQELSPEELVRWDGMNILDLREWNLNRSGDVFLTEELSADQVILEVYSKKINHLVQKNEKRLQTDMNVAKSLTQSRKEYFDSEFSFSDQVSQKILLPFGSAAEKTKLRDEFTAFVEKDNNASLVQCALSVFEELYMNAMLDAPREAEKKGITNDRKSEFFLSTSADSLQISCTDFFGSLETDKLLARMHEVYEKGAGEVINMRDPGGAGIGCVILFENCVSLVIGVDPGRQTKVTCILPTGVSNRQREKMKKSLHWFHI